MGACCKNSLVKTDVIRAIQIFPSNEKDDEPLPTKNSEREKNDSFLLFGAKFPRPRSSCNLVEPIPSETENRRGSFSGPLSRKSSFTKVPKTPEDLKIIHSALEKHFIFSNLTETQIQAITNEMQYFVYPMQKIIFEQGSIGDNFFIIAKGKVEVVINLKVAAVLNVGDSFGEVALLHDTPRTATIITLQETVLWGLDRITFRKILQNMNVQKFSENLVFIENVQMFRTLTKKQKESLANAMTLETYKSGHRILREGDTGDFMFIIKEGSVIVTKNGVEVRKLIKNDYFGEQALLQNNLRTATVTALEKVVCISISNDGLHATLGRHLQEIIHINTQRMAVDEDLLLKHLTYTQINSFIIKTKITSLKRGHTIKYAGCELDFIIIVLRGCIGTKTQKVKYLEIFNLQQVLAGGKILIENLVVHEDCDIAEISKKEFEESIGGRVNDVLERNEILKIIKEIPVFMAVDTKTLERVVKMLSVVRYRNRETIFIENQPGDSFFIVKSGNVEILKNGAIVRTVGKNDYFGERSMMFKSARSATVRAVGDVECWTLTQSQFTTIFSDQMKNVLLERIDLQDDKIDIRDLCCVRLIFQGRISNYFLCINRTNNKFYIIKTMQKSKIINFKMIDNVLMQKKIHAQMNNGMIAKLIKTYKDSQRLSMLMEYVPGVDFIEALKSLKKVAELDARFYAGCLVLILEYLHDHDIIYRDLNLKKILIDRAGYPKLIDFSCAKYIQGRTYTLVGTPHYISPEVITGNGYNFTADYWSLGVTLYKIMYGILPFGNSQTEPLTIYQDVINQRLMFPLSVDPLSKSRDFISCLLNKNPGQRGNMEKIKSHPWFVGLNWDFLSTKQIKGPFMPVIKDYTNDGKKAIMEYKEIIDEMPKYENQEGFYIPRFNVNNKWDAEF